MSPPSVIALGHSEAAMLLRRPDADVRALISICGRHEPPLDAPHIPRRLDLHFDDVAAPDLTSVRGLHRAWIAEKWAAETGRPQASPTVDDARAIIHFARRVKEDGGLLLCQCQAGVSRSPAAALLCMAAWTGLGREQECVEQLLGIRPCAAPHPGLIAFGDQLLGREGRLIAAVKNV